MRRKDLAAQGSENWKEKLERRMSPKILNDASFKEGSGAANRQIKRALARKRSRRSPGQFRTLAKIVLRAEDEDLKDFEFAS